VELISFLIPALVAVMVGVAAGYAAARILDKSRGRSAKSEADEIIKTKERGKQ
jgi:NhaP-type Na+/H+ or K+/H+ antiporter